MTIAEHVRDTLEPAWEIARIFPPQGVWSEADYLNLTDRTRHLIELNNGNVEVLAMPTRRHQIIIALLYRLMYAFINERNLGTLLFAALRVRVATGTFREPDLVFVLAEHAELEGEQYFEGADLVVEIVSPDDPARDLVTKRVEYAESGIAEYWIVNPINETITVLRLEGDAYAEHGVFQRGDQATSVLLDGLAVPVSDTFDAR